MSSILLEFFERDLLKLREEIDLYADESAIWEVRGGIANSAGALCLHLTGNLKHFIGAILGNTGYIRQRDQEHTFELSSRSGELSPPIGLILDAGFLDDGRWTCAR